MNVLGRSGVAARALLLLAATVAAALAAPAPAASLLALGAAALALARPRRLVALLLGLTATAVVYSLVLLAAREDPRLALAAATRFGVVLSFALLVASLTPAAAWARAAPGRLGLALGATASAVPVLARDVEAIRDAARMRGYGRFAGAVAALPAIVVRAARRGRLADESLAQAGLPAPVRYFRHRWNAHDTLAAVAAVALAGVALL